MAWIAGNRYLGLAEQQNNVDEIKGLIGGRWSVNALAAILGNMQSESNINPGIWESLKPYEGGYGLVQWTPYTKLTEWIMETYHVSETQALEAYSAQLDRIDYEASNGLQWFSNPKAPIKDPPISLEEFLQSELPPANLANFFLWYYEHPANPNQPIRASQADYWYEYLTGQIPPEPTPDPPFPGQHRKLPLYYYIKQI